MFQFFKSKEEAAATPEEFLKKLKILEEKLAKTRKELGETKEKLERSLGKVGMVRFNPFKEIGGNQSFSIAFLDHHDDGVVITSHFGRETNRVYAKQIKNGKAEHTLSKEEEEALKQAIHS
jgi:hypothetical protein